MAVLLGIVVLIGAAGVVVLGLVVLGHVITERAAELAPEYLPRPGDDDADAWTAGLSEDGGDQ